MATLASTIILWTRRLIKLGNSENISDSTILDYLNRFYLYDMPYRIQLFDLKTQYSFETEPNIDRYNLPVNSYNSILMPAFCDGVPITMCQSTSQFNNLFPFQVYNIQGDLGDGSSTTYSFTLATTPFVRGHTDVLGNLSPGVYVTGQDVNGNNLVLTDDGDGNLTGDGSGTVDYLTGDITANFNTAIASDQPINTQTFPYTAGKPTVVCFFNNTFSLRTVPDKAYLMTFDAYLTPSAFATVVDSTPFEWMADYLAHGTARRILKDLGDIELLEYNEPFFREQEKQVLRRTGRQNSNVRTATIFQGQLNGIAYYPGL